jgi:hypothetical protein
MFKNSRRTDVLIEERTVWTGAVQFQGGVTLRKSGVR